MESQQTNAAVRDRLYHPISREDFAAVLHGSQELRQ